MTSSSKKRSLAHRAGASSLLPPAGQATPETLLYLVGAMLLLVGVLLGYFNWKPHYSATEPIVVWKNDEPRLSRDAMGSGLLESLRIEHSSREAEGQRDSVPCTDLAENWFKPVPNPLNGGNTSAQEIPLSCDWTPGEPEVVIINR